LTSDFSNLFQTPCALTGCLAPNLHLWIC